MSYWWWMFTKPWCHSAQRVCVCVCVCVLPRYSGTFFRWGLTTAGWRSLSCLSSCRSLGLSSKYVWVTGGNIQSQHVHTHTHTHARAPPPFTSLRRTDRHSPWVFLNWAAPVWSPSVGPPSPPAWSLSAWRPTQTEDGFISAQTKLTV